MAAAKRSRGPPSASYVSFRSLVVHRDIVEPILGPYIAMTADGTPRTAVENEFWGALLTGVDDWDALCEQIEAAIHDSAVVNAGLVRIEKYADREQTDLLGCDEITIMYLE